MVNRPEKKKTPEQKAEIEHKKKLTAFFDAYNDAVLDLAKVHKMKMVPIIQATETGILPVFGVQNVIEVDKREDEKGDESKDVGSSDSDDHGTEE